VTLAILCSGQGAQGAGTFDLTASSAAAQPVLLTASALLGHDVVAWSRAATAVELQRNVLAQLLCCAQALAAWQMLALREHGFDADIILAGYSVGELAAWGCAGLLKPDEVLHLAGVRARAMDAAGGIDSGLVAVRGLLRDRLASLCGECDCEIAIVIADDQYLAGGTLPALDCLRQRAVQAGAQRVTQVPVAIASHTSRLRAASTAFRTALHARAAGARLAPGIRLLSGIDAAQVNDVSAGLDKLAQQISQPIEWQACLTACAEGGATHVLELGPGRALAVMAREVMPQARCRSLEEFRTIEGVRAWLGA
jgi:[acyl-carrier-protein] S-malonyltransferase